MADARAVLGEYLGTHADNLVYTQNVTISMNIVARSLELGAGDEVLTSDHEYGAMDRTWRFLAQEHGFTYINQPVSLASKEAFVESFWSGVTDRTRVIFLSHITSPIAVIFPVEEIIQRARAADIITVIDGAHVPGQIVLDLDSSYDVEHDKKIRVDAKQERGIPRSCFALRVDLWSVSAALTISITTCPHRGTINITEGIDLGG